ncbi:hypothetical protein OKA04_09240 [Luteolibacter flavescens]|uniref:SLA1 homology domain-containing protein n=1 Tax=Luteolibacter flavescens TaxID=1859460 RepID=A0ABT3FMW2_9BACT|nr:hypothetical protein [Luteolibacter flavescens]MCW1884910.1 hypothetical protein [Luteolibacter flavescens]
MTPLLRITPSLLALFLGYAAAQDARTWTDTKGRKLEGAFVKQDATTVWVRKGDGKEVAIPKATLSPDDQKHLETAKPAAPSATPVSNGARFATARIDPSLWKSRPEGFKIGTVLYPNTLETEHFIVAGSAKVRPAMLLSYAEAGERLWADIATDLPVIAAAFDGRKLPIILATDEKDAKVFASWHEKHASDSPSVPVHFNLVNYDIAGFILDDKFSEEAGLTVCGRIFRTDSKNAAPQRKTWPQRIHFLSDDILRHLLVNMGSRGEYSLAMVCLSFNYHREELICGKIESEVSFGGAGVEGFKNGRNWAGLTKKLLKDGASPDIDAFLKARGSEAEPRDLGFGLGLMHFIHADTTRRADFGKILVATAKDKKCPDAETFAKGLGYDSPDALNKAWKDFMLSSAFE